MARALARDPRLGIGLGTVLGPVGLAVFLWLSVTTEMTDLADKGLLPPIEF